MFGENTCQVMHYIHSNEKQVNNYAMLMYMMNWSFTQPSCDVVEKSFSFMQIL